MQAHSLAEEEDEDDEAEDEREQRPSAKAILERLPGTGRVQGRESPAEGSIKEPRNETTDANESRKSLPNGKASRDQPVASKIVALRAKLEADKAKRLLRSVNAALDPAASTNSHKSFAETLQPQHTVPDLTESLMRESSALSFACLLFTFLISIYPILGRTQPNFYIPYLPPHFPSTLFPASRHLESVTHMA